MHVPTLLQLFVIIIIIIIYYTNGSKTCKKFIQTGTGDTKYTNT